MSDKELPEWVHKNLTDIEDLRAAFSIAWEALDDITCHYDEAKDDCGICDKGIFGGHTKYCIVPDVLKAMDRIAELGSAPKAKPSIRKLGEGK